MEDLRRCISSIVEKSTWENYEIIVVENNSETKEIFSYYDELQNNPQIRVVTFEVNLIIRKSTISASLLRPETMCCC